MVFTLAQLFSLLSSILNSGFLYVYYGLSVSGISTGGRRGIRPGRRGGGAELIPTPPFFKDSHLPWLNMLKIYLKFLIKKSDKEKVTTFPI